MTLPFPLNLSRKEETADGLVIVNHCADGLTVSLRINDDPYDTVFIDAIFMGDWWISRVNVRNAKSQRKGFGSKILQLALSELQRRDAIKVFVSPGGYNMNHADQVKFYEKNGFKKDKEDTWVYVTGPSSV